jgi:glyoxylase-like metal-dependent hydrolase (beta-lactamase superfamily II)
MEKDGFKVEDVGLVICTHCHPDHFEAVDALVDRGALLALSREEYEFLQGTGKMFYSALSARLPRAKPYFYLSEGELNLGAKNKLNMKVLLTPGHSPGSICLYLDEQKILISGDVVFYGSVGRTDFPGGSASLLRQSIERLSQLDMEYIVPGHNTEMGNILFGKEEIKVNFQMVKMYFSYG